MWCSEDNHYLGVQPLVSDLDADLVMTACTTDWLFKGYGLERTYQRFLGKNLPLRKFTHERIDGFLPNVPGSPPDEFAEQIRERMDVCFQGCPRELRHNGDYLKVEDRRVRPACYTVSVSGPIMYRIYPYDTFLADSRVADCYARIKAAWKLNGDVWGLAAGKVCSSAQDIVDSNYGWAVNAGRGSKLLAFSKGWLRRRLTQRSATSDSNTDHPPSHASWPDFGWYVRRSPTLTGFWNDTSLEHRDLMYRLTGTELWSISLDEWSSNAPYFFRVLTLLQHWRNRDQLVSRLPASH
jgi:asparagine synthase (glutamine-hydrolysing)